MENIEKQDGRSITSKENGKKGGRPKTGQVERVLVSFPAEFIKKVDAQAGSARVRVRWMMERLESFLD